MGTACGYDRLLRKFDVACTVPHRITSHRIAPVRIASRPLAPQLSVDDVIASVVTLLQDELKAMAERGEDTGVFGMAKAAQAVAMKVLSTRAQMH